MRGFWAALVILLISPPALAQQAWYEGGTLQKANVSQWQAGSAANQLATCGDFVASLSGLTDLSAIRDSGTMADLQKRAEDLQVCINQSIQSGTPSNQSVAELVVRCTIMKPKE